MSQLLSLSRAARLVGVNRSELQKRVKQGELAAFDGMVTVDNLLASYPGVQLEDNTEYSRVFWRWTALALTLSRQRERGCMPGWLGRWSEQVSTPKGLRGAGWLPSRARQLAAPKSATPMG